MRKSKSFDKLFKGVPNIALEGFPAGAVAEILRVPMWRLQKFIDSPQYNFSPEGKLGKGQGSRRVFTREDIYRVALAARLVEDGFAAKVVGSILERFEDYDLNESHDQEGRVLSPLGFLGLVRGAGGPKVKFFHHQRPPKLCEQDSPYYVLNILAVTAEIDKRIARMKK
jgi:DNA-binding transcriptional MerR regulator